MEKTFVGNFVLVENELFNGSYTRCKQNVLVDDGLGCGVDPAHNIRNDGPQEYNGGLRRVFVINV
jgi:hypothetical protein